MMKQPVKPKVTYPNKNQAHIFYTYRSYTDDSAVVMELKWNELDEDLAGNYYSADDISFSDAQKLVKNIAVKFNIDANEIRIVAMEVDGQACLQLICIENKSDEQLKKEIEEYDLTMECYKKEYLTWKLYKDAMKVQELEEELKRYKERMSELDRRI